MSFNPASACPDWCDPRTHVDLEHDTPEHRTAGLIWQTVSADTEITVRTVRRDNTGPCLHTGDIQVSVHLEDTESLQPDGRPIEFTLMADPADIRMLAAALVCEAERVERLLIEVTR